jgi:hypothetical protein
MKKPEQQEEGEEESEEEGVEEVVEKEAAAAEELEEGEAKSSSNTSAEAGELKRELSDDEEEDDLQTPVADDCTFVTPINRNKKRKLIMPPTSDHGSTSICIPGTPIVTMNESGMDRAPDWENFSKDICDHKPFEMDLAHTPTGNFKKIIELTNQFKLHQSNNNNNNNNSSFS